KEVHRVQVFDFGGLPDLMVDRLSSRMLMEHRDAQGQSLERLCLVDTAGALQFQLGGVRRRMSWREFILALGLHTIEEMQTARDPILRLCHIPITCSITGRSQAPEKVTVTNLFYLRGMDIGLVNVPYLLASGAFWITYLGEAPLVDGNCARPPCYRYGRVADEGALAVPTPVQAPQTPPPAAAPAQTMAQRLARVEEDMHEI
ncbi:hypothetical protein Tco_1189525, partial [Tanacetum coccineum]